MIPHLVDILARRLAPAIALALLIGSIVVGLVLLSAVGFGYLPALGGDAVSLAPFRLLFSDGRLFASCVSTVLAGVLGTLSAVAMAFALAMAFDPKGTEADGWAQRCALAVLAVPHAALALGLIFVLAPSGWLMRALHAVIGAWPLPPDWQFVPNESGLALALVLFLKETPFLFFAVLTALRQLRPERHLLAAQIFGYAPHMAWMKLVLPQLYPLVRFPIFAVLAYSLSVVDMSLILGPTTPSTLPVLILKWASDPDLDQRFTAGAAALLQLGLVVGAILTWRLAEELIVLLARPWLSAGNRCMPTWIVFIARRIFRTLLLIGTALIVLAVCGLILWSVADSWRYPAILPQTWEVAVWYRSLGGLYVPLLDSLVLALATTSAALVLSVACLQRERQLRIDIVRSAEKWLFLPLLVPEICFLFGLQVLLLLIGLNGTWLAVLWMHFLFVFPYVFLTLKEPWRAFDPRYETAALTLGRSAWQVLWRVKLPMLRAPLSFAVAIGCTVSLSLYLPTMQGGEGRIETLATQAIALGAGGDRRIIGVFGLVQTLTAAMFFLLALRMARSRRWRPA